MKLSVQLFASRRGQATMAAVLDDLILQAQHAEAAGFETVWLAEHHRTDWNLCSDPLTVLAALARATTRIRLGAAVVNLGLHQLARVAEQTALVQALSKERLELGLGRGFAEADYRYFDLPAAAGGPEHFEAQHEELCARLAADPVAATVPLWLASSGNERTLARALDYGHGLLLTATDGKLGTILSRLRRQPTTPRVGLVRALHIGTVSELRPYFSWYMQQLSALVPDAAPPPLEEALRTFCIVGSPEHCVQQIAELDDYYPFHELICVPGIGGMGAETVGRVLHQLRHAVTARAATKRPVSNA